METQKNYINIKTIILAPISKVWEYWTAPAHITQWNTASDDWHTPFAENDLQPGGKFLSRMEAKDGSMGFDFSGVYTEVILHQCISYTMDDARTATTTFNANGDKTSMMVTFEAENTNPLDMQQAGWQAILDNFKKYVEAR